MPADSGRPGQLDGLVAGQDAVLKGRELHHPNLADPPRPRDGPVDSPSLWTAQARPPAQACGQPRPVDSPGLEDKPWTALRTTQVPRRDGSHVPFVTRIVVAPGPPGKGWVHAIGWS
ncbi:hypothetical protein GCM10020358_83450 [Amorphoplanes nipponensis]|uniref:Uncharacterized protein n=1 Tax=Actinoplanes nipponensis TaxID=135950 RepID=A0A919MMX7_9ACTN|nr:hypothetical protein Ani05nite_14170 [Actinoplanes nipponensis]